MNEIQIVYDPNKAHANLLKHKVSFDEVKIALFDPTPLSERIITTMNQDLS